MCTTSIYEARNNLSDFVKIAETEEPVVLTRYNKHITATAIANGMVLVTHNTEDFAPMVENSFLKLEDWFSE